MASGKTWKELDPGDCIRFKSGSDHRTHTWRIRAVGYGTTEYIGDYLKYELAPKEGTSDTSYVVKGKRFLTHYPKKRYYYEESESRTFPIKKPEKINCSELTGLRGLRGQCRTLKGKFKKCKR